MYVVVGASGFLGSYILRYLLSSTDERIIAASRRGKCSFADTRLTDVKCDILDAVETAALAQMIRGERDVRIIYLAAIHSPDFIFKNPDTAARTNIDALERFLNLTDGAGRVYYSSSDVIYGEGSPDYRFTEGDSPSPVNLYGVQKAAAESLVLEHGGTVLRFSLLAAHSPVEGRLTFIDTVARSLLLGRPFGLFTDFVRSGIGYAQAAELTVRLCETQSGYNIFNIGGDEALSKYEIGLRLADSLGVSRGLVIPELSSQGGVFTERRAKYLLIDNSLVKTVLGLDEIIMKI